MLDLHGVAQSLHTQLTGTSKERSLESARLVHAAGKLHELRYLLIPGKTDCATELNSLAAFAASLGDDVQVRLNAFQHHGVRGDALAWDPMTEAGVESAAATLRTAGVGNVVTPAVFV